MAKRPEAVASVDSPPAKKIKKEEKKTSKPQFEKKTTLGKKAPQNGSKFPKAKPAALSEKPEDWNEFKKQKKELKLQRKQKRTGFDMIVQAKRIGEKLRCKTLKGGAAERNDLIDQLHSMLKGQDLYPKLVLAHDTSRIVQWLLKYSATNIKKEISKELVSSIVGMLRSKYGVHCAKRLLKYGSPETRSAIIKNFYGHVVKLTSHSVSAPVFEYAYLTWATPQQKSHLCQEYFGDLYKRNKDDTVKHLRDTYEKSPELKLAILGATKANLLHVINKNLLDSGLVQTVINQFLTECTAEDKSELISLLVPHIVVISNSKDGSRAAMQCIWHGTNKDRKLAMKTLKEHVVELSQHEHGHCTVIALLNTADDTVLLHKLILSELLEDALDLAKNEWGRKVLLWLVAPADLTCFHPVFVKELEEGRTASSSKKSTEARRSEILEYSSETLLKLVKEDPKFWLSNSSLAVEMLAILKAGGGKRVVKALKGVVGVIVDPDWKIKVKDVEVLGVEDAGLHMVMKKLAKHDAGFATCLVEALNDDVLQVWLPLNRACFLLVLAFENGENDVREALKTKLTPHLKLLKKQNFTGGKILLKKIS